MAVIGVVGPLLLVEFAFWLCWGYKSVAVSIRGLLHTSSHGVAHCSYVSSSPLSRYAPSDGFVDFSAPSTAHGSLRQRSIAFKYLWKRTPGRVYASSLRRSWQPRTHAVPPADEVLVTEHRLEVVGHGGTERGACGGGTGHWNHAVVDNPVSYRGYLRPCGRVDWRRRASYRDSLQLWSNSAGRTLNGDHGSSGPVLDRGEAQQYPENIEAFQQALLRMDARFLKISNESNEEILQSLGMLWRQRRLEQLQEEVKHNWADGWQQTTLYDRANAAVLGRPDRRSDNAFRARAYKMAYEILHQARIPIYNIAEVLLLLREGGLVLRGEEANIVKRGAFRSAVLQKIHMVLSHGIAEVMKKSRSVLREGALQDLSRLPGVTKRTAAVLFDEQLISSAHELRRRVEALHRTVTQQGTPSSPSPWLSATPSVTTDTGSPGKLSSSDACALAKIFPTDLARVCVIHADSFSAAMDTTEFDEWQQQLLLVQENLRETDCFVQQLPLDLSDAQKGAYSLQDVPSNVQALPVVSLGGGIFHGSNSKLISLSVQISLLPSWTEFGNLPPALDQAICSGGQGAGREEKSWLKRQWDHVSKAYRKLRRQLHQAVVEALKQRHLLENVICDNSKTKTTHAAGRLPWRQETYRLVTVSTVSPGEFPFATLAARCSASAYRLLQNRTRKRWGWTLTPSGLAEVRPKTTTKPGAGRQDTGTTSAVPYVPAEEATEDADSLESIGHEGSCSSALTADQAMWVFDEQGVLRLLQEPLSMQERIGKASVYVSSLKR